MHTQNRLLKEQSAQDLYCLPFQLHHLDALLHCKNKLFHFRIITAIILSVPFLPFSRYLVYRIQEQMSFSKTVKSHRAPDKRGVLRIIQR